MELFGWVMLIVAVGIIVGAYVIWRRGISSNVFLGEKPVAKKKMVKLPVKNPRKPRKPRKKTK